MALSAYFVRSSFHTLCFWWRWETRLRQHVSTVNVMRLYIMYILNQLNCDFMPFIPVFCVLTVRNIWIHSSSFGPGKKVFFKITTNLKIIIVWRKRERKRWVGLSIVSRVVFAPQHQPLLVFDWIRSIAQTCIELHWLHCTHHFGYSVRFTYLWDNVLIMLLSWTGIFQNVFVHIELQQQMFPFCDKKFLRITYCPLVEKNQRYLRTKKMGVRIKNGRR